MTIEYVVFGGILIVMGAMQIWLRHGPEGRKLQVEQKELSQRLLENSAPGSQHDAAVRADKRRRRLWSSWTAVLGFVAVAFGIAALILGLIGT
jgi:hypothetical protein